MDSPDKSLYTPVSLADTLSGPQRTYRATANSASSGFTATASAKDRSQAAKKEAAAMCEMLGLSGGGGANVEATPKPGRSLNSTRTADKEARGPLVEVVSLRSTLEGKEQEIAAMRKELAALAREKRDLLAKVDRLEKAAQTNKAALDVKQMERLEKEFEVQEQMLAGFQKENEKQALEVDRLKTRQRRMGEFLERAYGPYWQDELGLADRPGVSAASPAVRGKLAARASLLGTPVGLGALARSTSFSTSLAQSAIPESPTDVEPPSPSGAVFPSVPTASPPVPPAISPTAPLPSLLAPALDRSALPQHLESIQALLRAMEARLVARDIELAAVEKRAKEERAKAHEMAEELERTVQEAQSMLPVGVVAAAT
ncbi:mannose-6-phosphate isomerase [Rhodotorula toruloides]|uniref:Mannose-6-phosphate isomerase n=1 Tax=Rhodotorula toruloides TaxID=5286 RepID=A0A511K8M2_RHOTO|nr:mannose-6-phosphate isomerase [Rhodotorula toruloides]